MDAFLIIDVEVPKHVGVGGISTRVLLVTSIYLP